MSLSNGNKVKNWGNGHHFYSRAPIILGDHWQDLVNGIIMPEDKEHQEASRIKQERHNLGHVLWFLSTILFGITNGSDLKKTCTTQTTDRIIAHLVCLREYVPSSNYRLKLTVRKLIEELIIESPSGKLKWSYFFLYHWPLLRSFAGHWNEEDKCFPEGCYLKVKDVVERKHTRRWWWVNARLKYWAKKASVKIKSFFAH